MMTDDQLERAAREFCRIGGIDPEARVATSPPPNPDGTINAVLIYVFAWERWAELIAQHDTINYCILVGKAVTEIPSHQKAETP